MSVASLPQGARVHKCYSAPASRTDFEMKSEVA